MIDLSGRDTRSIMTMVALCLAPGLLLQGLLLDIIGVALNVLAAVTAGVLTERGCEALRGRAVPRHYSALDATTLVTCLIIAAALPPGAWAFAALAAALGVGLGRQAYGGLGNNLFNPAMVGYCLVLVSFPAAFNWPGQAPDALSGATVLTTFKYRGTATVDDIWTAEAGFGAFAGLGYEWIAATYAAGGAVLFYRRLAAWRPAAGFLLALTIAAALGYDNGSSESLGSPRYHLFAGSSLMAAAFVLTDPVTHPRGHRAQWLFGAAVGLMTFAVRAWGNYPDGIAFAVLLGNALGPYLDRRLSVQVAAND